MGLMEDNKQTKQFIEIKKNKETLSFIKNKIIDYLINIINQKGGDYEYTNIMDLIEMSEQFIDDERKYIARNIEYFSFEEEDIITLSRLLKICETYNIK